MKIFHQPPLQRPVGDHAGVVGLELVLGQVAVLVDLVPPGLVAGQEGLVVLQDLLLVLLQGRGPLLLLLRVVNWRLVELLQELLLVQ